jgi:methyl-accepting chemotaxis protein
MSLKLKLTVIITAMIMVVVVALSVCSMVRTAQLQKISAYENADEMAKSNSVEIQRRVENILNYASMLSQVFSDYETIDESVRRVTFNELSSSIIEQNKDMMGIFTAWNPNTIDSYDAEQGQYQIFYTRRRTGNVELVPAGYDGWETYLAEMTGKPVLAEPVWRDIINLGNVPILSAQYPIINSSGTVVGVVGINYVSSIQQIADDLAKEIYDGAGVTGVYTNNGTILAHYDKERVGTNMRTNPMEIKVLGNDADHVINAISEGQWVALDKFSNFLQKDVHFIYYPIRFSGIDTFWSLMVVIPMENINQPIIEMLYFTIVFSLVILVIAAILTFFVSRNIVKPIIGVTNTLKDISEGEGDLTRTIAVHSKDEVGRLAQYFNQTLEKIKNLIITIKKESVTLSGVGNDLASNMHETASAMNQITSNIESIKGRVINQSASVSQTHSTMEQLMGNIKKLDGQVDDQSANISLASSAIEEMVANIKAVNDTLIKNSANVSTLIDSSEIGRSGLQEVAEGMHEISKDSEGLMAINSVIKDIASQTNLLSMNAAIEAAHAGDAGKGFGVVANEIRKLAESSSTQSKTIETVLKKIKESIDKISLATANVLDKFEDIDSNVKIVAEQEETIRNAMQEQQTGSQQLLLGAGNLNEITHQVTTGSNQMLVGAKEVINESDNLEKATQEITSGMNEMASGAQQINIAVNQINEISFKNREGIESLLREVSRFKVA